MKRIPMSQQARLKAAERRKRHVRAAKITVMILAVVTAALWAYVFFYA